MGMKDLDGFPSPKGSSALKIWIKLVSAEGRIVKVLVTSQ